MKKEKVVVKKWHVILVIVGIFLLQAIVNPAGYNFISIIALAALIFYFDEIKTLSFGLLKLEKYEKLTMKIDERLPLIYKALLQSVWSSSSGGSFFAQEEALIRGYTEIIPIFEEVNELPSDLRNQLSDDMIRIAKQVAMCQLRILSPEKMRGLDMDRLPLISENEASEKVRKLKDYDKAMAAYTNLLEIIKKCEKNKTMLS